MSRWLNVHINNWKLWLSEKHNFRGCLNMMDIKKKGGGVERTMLDVKTYFCLHNKFSNIIDGGMAIEAINILIARFEVYETSLVAWDEEVQHKSYQRPDPPSAHTRVTSTSSDISQFQQQSQISFTDSSLSHEKKKIKNALPYTYFNTTTVNSPSPRKPL